MKPGAMVSEVVRQWLLSSQQVFGWRREARAGLLALPMDGAVANLPVLDFVPILAELGCHPRRRRRLSALRLR